jgi:hypothetical protein
MSKKSSVDCGSPSSRDSLVAKKHCSCAVVMWKKTQYYPLLLWTSLTRFSWPWSMWMLTAFFVTSKTYQLFFWQSTCTPLPCLRPAWLDYWVADHEVHFPGYCLFHSDRNRCGGGVAIYCAENLPCSLLCGGTSSNGDEFLWISVKSSCFNPLALGCFYITLLLWHPSSLLKCVTVLRIWCCLTSTWWHVATSTHRHASLEQMSLQNPVEFHYVPLSYPAHLFCNLLLLFVS